MVGQFVEVFRKRVLKVNAGEGLVYVDGVCLDYVSEFRYLGCVLDELGTDGAECSRKVAIAIRSLVNDRNLQIE